MRTPLAVLAAVGLIAPLVIVAAQPAAATSTGIEVFMDDNELTVVGHPSAPGASAAQVSGDILITIEGSSFVVSVDEESGGGAQLWSTHPSCYPATGQDVMRVTCAIPNRAEATAYIDLDGIDERGSGRIFAVVGDIDTTFFGSPYDDYFQGGAGDDYIEGMDGADSLYGGSGDDEIIGGAGPDFIDVENDQRLGETGVDIVDCNDDESRGTDNDPALGPVNTVDFDKGEDTIYDCAVGGAPVAKTRPTILSDPQVGIPVQGKNGEWEGKNLRFSYKWASCVDGPNPYVDCKDVATETSKVSGMTYVPTAADEGRLLLFSVFATNSAGTYEMTSDFSAPVVKPQGPANIYLPWFSETFPRETRKVSFNTGLWDTKKGDTFAYVLERCQTLQSGKLKCYRIQAGKTQSNKTIAYTPEDDDVDLQLRVTVTATRKVQAGKGSTVLETVASSWRTAAVRALEEVVIPNSWSPRPNSKTERYSFTNVSAIDTWLVDTRKRFFSPAVNVVRVGLPEILSTKKYESLRKYRQYLPMSDGAILAVTPGFGEKLKGYPGQNPPPQVTVVVYDKTRDLDSCAAAIEQSGWFSAMQSDTLQQAVTWLTRAQCPNWRVEWSATESKFPYSWVEKVRVDKTVNDGVATSTIVVTARPPRMQSLFLTLQSMGIDEAQSYPDHLTLTWDGDVKAGARSSFNVWPMLAATGQLMLGGRAATIELFDVDGRRLSSVDWNALNTGGTLQLDPIPMSAVFSTPGTARVLVRVVDAAYQMHEVYADIPVRAATGAFATLDGRCWFMDTSGQPQQDSVSSCPEAPAAARATAEFFAEAFPDYTTACSATENCANTYVILQKAAAYVGSTPALSNLTYSVSMVNTTFRVTGPQVHADFSPRANCDWWNLVCIVKDFFTPKKARVAVKAYKKPGAPPPPQAPPTVVDVTAPTLAVSPTSLAAGLAYESGCTLVGADYGVGCGGAFNATKFPANASDLINLDGGTLINLDGGTVVGTNGATLINLDGGTIAQQASPTIVSQAAGGLSVPVSPLIGAGSLN